MKKTFFEQFNKKEKENEKKKGEDNKKEAISQEELDNRVNRIKKMGKAIGEDFGMKVEVGNKEGWRYKFKSNKIEVDPNDIKEKGLEYCFGVIAHEGSHRKISRTDFIPDKVWKMRGFSFLMNAIEDPRVNNWVSEKYDGARDWLEQFYNQDIPTEEKVKEVSEREIGYTPKHIKFGLEVIKYWHTGEFSDDLPDDVREALDKTVKSWELAYENIPDPQNPKDEEIEETAQTTYKIAYSRVWPEYQKLVEEALDEEKIRQMIKDMLENDEIELDDGETNDQGEPLPMDDIPEDLREELKKKLKEKLDDMDNEEREDYEEDAEKRAKENLDDLEDAENEELRGELNEQPETNAEEREKKEREELDKKAEEALEGAREELEEEMEKQKTEYDRALEEVQPYVDKVADDIINLFIQKRWPEFKKSFPGQRLRLEGAMDYESRKDYRQLFETREKEERQEYNFLILVDLSGSMRGEKIDETFKGTVLFSEALNKVGKVLGNMKVGVYGFQNELIEYKESDDDLDNNLREKMSMMKEEVENSGEHNQADYNNDGYCVNEASQILEQMGEGNNFLFVLTDGLPNGDEKYHVKGFSKENEEEELIEVVKRISQTDNTHLLGVGLGPETEHVRDFYSEELRNVENIPNVKVKDLSDQLAKKLEQLVK